MVGWGGVYGGGVCFGWDEGELVHLVYTLQYFIVYRRGSFWIDWVILEGLGRYVG